MGSLYKKVLEIALVFEPWLGNLEEDLRKWGFVLDLMLPESRSKSKIG